MSDIRGTESAVMTQLTYEGSTNRDYQESVTDGATSRDEGEHCV
jgi:hypothetical protein